MNNDGIEDILISRDYNNTKKKKTKFVLVLFFMLLIMLVAFIGAYWYLTTDNVSSKQLFVQNISKININKLLKNEIYTNLVNKMQEESSQIDSSIKFTTDLEKEELQDIDVTKFDLKVSNSNDVINKKNYNEAILNYSGNEIFKVKLITAENEAAVASDEIMNQYVGLHLDKIKEVFGIDIDLEKIKRLKETENIDFSEEEFNEYLQKYFEIILNDIPEEKFAIQENIAIENATENVEVTNYTVTLSQEELKNLIIKFLENLNNDEELINKLIVNSNVENAEGQVENIETEINEEQTESVQTEVNEEQTENIQPEVNEEQVENVESEPTQPEEDLESEIPVIHVNPVGTINVENANVTDENTTNDEGVDSENLNNQENENIISEIEVNSENSEDNANTEEIETIETTNIDELINKENNIKEQISNIFFGKKANLTKEEFNKFIDDLIKEVQNLSGNGLKINVYASENNVEKLNIVLSDNSIIDIDLIPDENPDLNSNQSYIKITYLSENENAEKNGFAIEVNKEQSNASTTIDAEYSFIENEKINQKIKINLKTNGTINSTEIKNDIVFTISTNKSETQIAVDNKIEFKDVTDLPGLNSENCIYLDMLPENERQTLLETIKNQIMTLYTNKKDNLNFIDTNTYTQTTLENQTQNQTSTVTREVAKEALINKIVTMMDEAIARNEEFTIQDLADLKIDGYKVSVAVTSESALIVVDVYKFNIDTGFMLTDVE